MATVGLHSGVKTLAEIGVTPGNSGAANTAAWNAAVGDSGPPLTVLGDTATAIPLAGPLRWPVTRAVAFDGRFVTVLSQQTAGAAVFEFFNSGNGENAWQQKHSVLRAAQLNAGSGGAACVRTDNTGDYACRFHKFDAEDLSLWTNPASTANPGYGIDLTANYSIFCRVHRVESFFGGPIRWRYGPAETHATSLLDISQCRSHVAAATRYAPDYWLDGHRNLFFRQNVFEGEWGFAPGVDGVALYDGAIGVLLDNPGPQLTLLQQNWPEPWGTRANPLWYSTVVRNPFSGSAGPSQPRTVFIMGMPGYTLAKNHPASVDPFTVYVEKSPGVTIDKSGPVDVIHRDQFGIPFGVGTAGVTESGQVAESPVAVARYEPAAVPLYVFPGGTGSDGGGLTRTGNSLYPHRHPVHGACLAMRGYGGRFTLPAARRPSAGRLFTEILAASPHHVRQGGHADGLWVRFGGIGEGVFRAVADGFAPTRLKLGQVLSAPESQLMFVGDWRSQPPSGTLYLPAAPWLLVYGLAASLDAPTPARRYWPAEPTSSAEWSAGAGPPPGTYGSGDRVTTLNGGLPYICTVAGTSRPIAVTATRTSGSFVLTAVSAPADLLEGDWVAFTGVGAQGRARVESIAANGDVTLNQAAVSSGSGTAVANAAPTFKQRLV